MSSDLEDGIGEFSRRFLGIEGQGCPVKEWTHCGGCKDWRSRCASTHLRVPMQWMGSGVVVGTVIWVFARRYSSSPDDELSICIGFSLPPGQWY